MARLAGFEPTALCSGGTRSIRVSYRRLLLIYYHLGKNNSTPAKILSLQGEKCIPNVLYEGVFYPAELGQRVAFRGDYVGEA